MSAKGKVVASRLSYQPVAHCSICAWDLEDVDPRKMSREARKHCAGTGHAVWIDWNTSSKYELKTDGTAAEDGR